MAREYKDSGIEWIGQIPKEWGVNKIKYVSNSINKGNGITKEEVFADGDTPCVRYGEIYSKYNISFDHCFSATRKEIQKSPRYFNKGDILLAGTGELVDEIGKNIVYLGEDTCLAGGDIIVLSHHQSPSFLNYALNCHSSQAQKSRNKAKLKVVHISATEIGDIIIALPSIPIQQKIADYLDKVCGEVEEMVAIQETMIEELKAYKQSVITEAVTKGLNPNVPMRNSGIDWIGGIPKHWEVIKMRRCVDSIGDVDHYMPDSIETGIPYIMTRDLADRTSMINKDQCKQISYEDYVNLSRKIKLEKNDVIFARYASIGNVCYVDTDEEMIVSYSCVIIKPLPILSGLYLFYYLKSKTFEEEVLQFVNTNIQGNVGIDSLYKTKMMMPPLVEQRAIASYLDTKCSEIDALIALKQAKIEELKEYKKSLIYEYVTGKKEVV